MKDQNHSDARCRRPLCRSLVALALAVGVVSCTAPAKRNPDPSCTHCYRTDSGILYKTWEAYDP